MLLSSSVSSFYDDCWRTLQKTTVLSDTPSERTCRHQPTVEISWPAAFAEASAVSILAMLRLMPLRPYLYYYADVGDELVSSYVPLMNSVSDGRSVCAGLLAVRHHESMIQDFTQTDGGRFRKIVSHFLSRLSLIHG